MQALDQPRTRAKLKARSAQSNRDVSPGAVIATLEEHILVDGFKLIFDAEKSHGSHFVDAATGRSLIDLYS